MLLPATPLDDDEDDTENQHANVNTDESIDIFDHKTGSKAFLATTLIQYFKSRN